MIGNSAPNLSPTATSTSRPLLPRCRSLAQRPYSERFMTGTTHRLPLIVAVWTFHNTQSFFPDGTLHVQSNVIVRVAQKTRFSAFQPLKIISIAWARTALDVLLANHTTFRSPPSTLGRSGKGKCQGPCLTTYIAAPKHWRRRKFCLTSPWNPS